MHARLWAMQQWSAYTCILISLFVYALKDSTSTRIERHQIAAIVRPRRRLVDPHRRHSLIDSSSRLPPPEHQALPMLICQIAYPSESRCINQPTAPTATRGLVMTSFAGPRRSNPDVPKCNSQQHLRRAAASRIRGRDSSLVWIGPTPPGRLEVPTTRFRRHAEPHVQKNPTPICSDLHDD